MNLLIFVTALLLSLSAISYQSLHKFLNTTHSQALWDKELKEKNSCRFNSTVNARYKELNKAQSNDDEKQGAEPNGKDLHPEASKNMNFRYFIDEKIAHDSPTERALYVEVAKRLIEILYSEQPFYKALLAMRPDLLDAFFTALLESNNGPKKIAMVNKMNKLAFNDPVLKEFYYAIMKPSSLGKEGSQTVSLGEKNVECDTVTFQDYLSDKNSKKIRVFLAPPALLMALFNDRNTVLSIIDMRRQLYKEVLKEKDAKDATQEFKNAFSGYSSYQELLDFSVGKTNPY